MFEIILPIVNFLSLSLFLLIEKQRRYIIFIFIIFHAFLYSIIITLRDFNHGDSSVYLRNFTGEEPRTFELGFNFLTSILKFLNNSEYMYFFTIALIFTLLVNITIYKHFKEEISLLSIWGITCFYTFFYFSFEIIRDGISYSIMLVAIFNYFKEKNNIKYYLTIILASIFHISAIFFILLPIFVKINRKYYFIIILFSFLLGQIFIQIINSVSESTPEFTFLLKLIIYREQSGGSKTIILRNILNLITFCIFYFILDDEKILKPFVYFICLLFFTISFVEMNRRMLFKGTYFSIIGFISIFNKFNATKIIIVIFMFYGNLFLLNYIAFYGLLDYIPTLNVLFE